MELVDVVDINSNYTGEVVTREEAQKRKLGHWEVIIIIINDKRQVLLQKRSANKKYYPNKWALCSGLVISKESVDEAAIRELKEEIGVDFSFNDLNVLDSNLNLTRFYYVKCNESEDFFTIQESELSCVKWFDLDEVIQLIEKNDERFILSDRIYGELLKLKKLIDSEG